MTEPSATADISVPDYRRLRPLLVAKGHKGMTNEEHLAIVEGVRAGGRRAKELLVLAHDGMLWKFVSKSNSRTDRDELYQEAVLAMFERTPSWEPARASFWDFMSQALKRSWQAPNSGYDSVITVPSCAKQYETGAKHLGKARQVASLDAPLINSDGDGDSTLYDMISDHNATDAIVELDDVEHRSQLLNEFAATLTGRWSDIFRRVMRGGETYHAFAAEQNVTKARIGQQVQKLEKQLAKFIRRKTGVIWQPRPLDEDLDEPQPANSTSIKPQPFVVQAQHEAVLTAPSDPPVRKLRNYQDRAVEHVIATINERPGTRILVVLPTGGGKTAIAAELIKRLVTEKNRRGLFFAHRRELVRQARASFVDGGIPETNLVRLRGTSTRIEPGHLCVATTELLQYRDPPQADVIISDEAHRDASDGRRALRQMYQHAIHIGFTATPERLDGKSLRKDYDELYVVAIPSDLIAEGYLAAPRIFTVPRELLPNLEQVRTTAGEFDKNDLDKATNRVALIGSIVEHWARMANGRQTLVFATSIEHSKNIIKSFTDTGVKAVHIDNLTPNKQRKATLQSLADGTIQVVSSCDLLSEGIDVPRIKCIVMARPTKSLIVFNQQAGRCMRPWSPTPLIEDRITPIILDHAGNTRHHGYPHADREWSFGDMTGRQLIGSDYERIQETRECPYCHEVVLKRLPVCTGCGKDERNLVVVDGNLVPFIDTIPQQTSRSEYERLMVFAQKRGFGAEWAQNVFKLKFGVEYAAV